MRIWTIAAAGIVALASANTASAVARAYPLVITNLTNGTVVAPGQTITVSVTIKTGTYPNGITVVGGQVDGPTVILTPVTTSPASFSVTIPSNAIFGPYTITAIGMDSTGTTDTSAAITLDVEQTTTAPVSLRVDPSSIHFAYIGQILAFNVIGVYANGSWQGLTQSSTLKITSANTSIATVTGGSVTAVNTGNTTLAVSYGSLTATIPVYVPNTPPP